MSCKKHMIYNTSFIGCEQYVNLGMSAPQRHLKNRKKESE